MKGSKGYIIALVFGLCLGWLGQQFWLIKLDNQGRMSDVAFLHSEKRLELLRQDESVKPASRHIAHLETPPKHPHLQSLLEQGYFDQAAQKIIDGGVLYTTDSDLIKQLSEEFIKRGEYNKAFSFLYELRLFVEPDLEAAYLSMIYEFVSKIDSKLEEKKQLPQLISFYRLLIGFQADYPPYYLRLSYWLLKSGDYDLAEQSLLGARNDIRYQKQYELLQANITKDRNSLTGQVSSNDSLASSVSIPLLKKGSHYIVKLSGGDLGEVNLMLDTGATMTVVKRAIVESNNPSLFEKAKPLKLSTANGAVDGVKIILPEITLSEGLRLNDVEIGVMPLPDFQYDGLLGMNVLSRFKFFLDQENDQLILNPK